MSKDWFCRLNLHLYEEYDVYRKVTIVGDLEKDKYEKKTIDFYSKRKCTSCGKKKTFGERSEVRRKWYA